MRKWTSDNSKYQASKALLNVAGLVFCLISSSVSAQSQQPAQATGDGVLRAGPGPGFAAITAFQPNTQFIIIPPKSVVIGKGVTIGKGVLIEGKPWHQVQLPDGRTGYVAGSLICTTVSTVKGTAGLCPGQ